MTKIKRNEVQTISKINPTVLGWSVAILSSVIAVGLGIKSIHAPSLTEIVQAQQGVYDQAQQEKVDALEAARLKSLTACQAQNVLADKRMAAVKEDGANIVLAKEDCSVFQPVQK